MNIETNEVNKCVLGDAIGQLGIAPSRELELNTRAM